FQAHVAHFPSFHRRLLHLERAPGRSRAFFSSIIWAGRHLPASSRSSSGLYTCLVPVAVLLLPCSTANCRFDLRRVMSRGGRKSATCVGCCVSIHVATKSLQENSMCIEQDARLG